MAFWSSATSWVKKNKILALIILGGLILRLLGTNPGYFAHGDEVMYGEAIYMLLNKTLSMEINLLGYPPLVAWMMLVSFVVFFIPLSFVLFFIKNFQDVMLIFGGISQSVDAGMVGLERIFYNEILGGYWINAMYWGRYLTAIFGAGLVVLVYKLVIVYFKDKKTALIGAFLTAINYRLVLSSFLGLPDIYNTFFFVLALLAIGNLINKSTQKNYIYAWIAVALSFLVKFQIYAILPLFVVHFWISIKENRKRIIKNFFNRKVIIGGLISLLIVVVVLYYHFINWEKFVAISEYQVLKYAFGRNLLNIFPISYFFHVGIGPAISVLGLSGILVGLLDNKSRFRSFILLSPLSILFFLYLYYTGGGFFTRNLIAIIPIIIVFAAFMMNRIVSLFIKNRYFSLGVLSLLTLLVARENIRNSFIALSVYKLEAPITSAQKWVEENISGEIVYGVYPGYPTPIEENVEVVNLTPPNIALSYRELLSEGFDYITLDLTVIHDTFLWWMGQAPEMAKRFWKKPNDLFSQTYSALVVRELLWDYTLNAFLTPWQAPGYNFAIVELKNLKEFENEIVINKFSFEDSDWTPLSYSTDYMEQLEKSKTGMGDRSALSIKKGGSLPGAVRWESPAMDVKGQHGYEVRGWIKADKKVGKAERDGFLRLDFYESFPGNDVLSRPIISFVSERYYGDGEWKKFVVSGVAPDNAKYGVIGFQIDSPTMNVYLDEVEIKGTTEVVKEQEVKRFTIEDDDFFLPNNQGFL